MVGVEIPMLPVRRQSRLFGQQPRLAEEDVLELVARAAADIGEISVGVEGGVSSITLIEGPASWLFEGRVHHPSGYF